MPKVFSSLRRLFLKENKVSKYLIYALGEIILIVIGILLALQIDNWNSTRNDHKKELAYAKSLLTDLEKDRESLLQFKENALEIGMLLDTLMSLSERDFSIPAHADTLHLYFRKAMRLRTWSRNDRTINQLESNADYILLRPNVADSVSTYNQMVDQLEKQGNGCNDRFKAGWDAGLRFLHYHLIRYSSGEYITFDGKLTGKHLPPLSADETLYTELFNQSATYQGCLFYYVVELVSPLIITNQSLIDFLEEEYGLNTS